MVGWGIFIWLHLAAATLDINIVFLSPNFLVCEMAAITSTPQWTASEKKNEVIQWRAVLNRREAIVTGVSLWEDLGLLLG